jgi:hypothetical protein
MTDFWDGMNNFHEALDSAITKLLPQAIYTHGAHKFRESGDRLRGGCPWHQSKSGTAFVVTMSTKQWYCSGCHFGGGPIQYLHRLQGGDGAPRGQEFIDLAKKLCEMAGVELPEQKHTLKDSRRYHFLQERSALLADVSEFCQILLKPEHHAYLLQRGFTEEHVKNLHIGFYDITALREHLKGYSKDLLEGTGILWKKLQGYLSFPWLDAQGRHLTLYFKWPSKFPPSDLPKTTALPNPKLDGESCLESKYVPYLFDRTKGRKHLVLVEGVTDAGLAQVLGDNRVIACVAASLSRGQVQTLSKAGVKTVAICLDPDKAGDHGVESCVKHLSGVGIRALVAPRLPDGMDPDEFIFAHGIEAWKSIISKATEWGTKVVAIPQTFTAAELQNMDCPEPSYLVPGILPEGVSLIAGRPKMGKSFLILEILLAIACGGFVLGREEIKVLKRAVLYITLEDIPRRLKGRIHSLSGDSGWAQNFHMATSCPKFDQGGIDALETWLDLHPDVSVVVIDTWGRIKGRANGKSDAYENDVRLMEPIKCMADKRGVSIILVHHTRKLPGEDPLDEVSGSTGLTGSVDCILLLRRDTSGKPTLYIRGRDVEENELALQREKTGGWTLLGKAEERLTEEQAAAVDALRQAGKPLTSKAIRAVTGQSISACSHMMRKLLQRGIVESFVPGVFSIPKKVEVLPHSTHSTCSTHSVCSTASTTTVEGVLNVVESPPIQPKNGSQQESTATLNALNALNRFTQHKPSIEDLAGLDLMDEELVL